MDEIKILQFKPETKLSDGEITGLFLGLSRIVRRCAMEDAQIAYERKIADLEKQIKLLSEINFGLNEELVGLKSCKEIDLDNLQNY